jgi:hypothetical protein
MVTVEQTYSPRAEERRRQFNKIIDGIDMVLINNIPEVDPSVFDNFDDESPFHIRPCEWFVNKATTPSWCCNTHMYDGTDDYPATGKHLPDCDFAEDDTKEVYQWFAVNQNDADFLKRHGQYTTYSEVLDTHFLAITHYGTSWDYVDDMVEAFNDCYVGLENFSDEEKK